MYIKDLRKNFIRFDAPVHRYDNKYYYLEMGHADSILAKVGESFEAPILEVEELPTTTVDELIANAEFPSLTRPQLIVTLLRNNYTFSDVTQKWFAPGTAPTRYIITSVQNNVATHSCFKTLKRMAKAYNAELLAIPSFYKVLVPIDPDAGPRHYAERDMREPYDYWFPENALPYMSSYSGLLGSGVKMLGNIRVMPTACEPISGLEDMTTGNTTIIGHPQLRLKSIPTPIDKRPIFLWTTGSCSEKSYSDSKAGQKAYFRHSFGGLLVEFDKDGDFFIRPLIASETTGDIVDLTVKYSPDDKVEKVPYELRPGDWHLGESSPEAEAGMRSLIRDLGKPEHLYLEDVFDGSTVNHHEAKNPIAKLNAQFCCVQEELDANAHFLTRMSKLASEVVVIESNHHDWLDRWLIETDWRTLSPDNLKLWIELLDVKNTLPNHKLYPMMMVDEVPDNVVFLHEDDDCSPFGVQQALHGHNPIDGARNRDRGLMRLGQKINQGHYHSAGIRDSVWTAGKMARIKQSYMKGLSSHSHTMIITYPGGKRQMVTLYKGAYKA